MINNKLISSSIEYDDWLNNPYSNIFSQLYQNYLTLKNPRFKIFTRYEDTNLGYTGYNKMFAICVGAAKFRKTDTGPHLIFFIHTKNNFISGWQTYIPGEEEMHNYSYTFDKFINPTKAHFNELNMEDFDKFKKNFIKNFKID